MCVTGGGRGICVSGSGRSYYKLRSNKDDSECQVRPIVDVR